MLKRRLIIIISMLVIIGGSYGLMTYFASLKKTQEQRPPEKQKRYVKAEPIIYSDVEVLVSTTGRLASQQYVDISSEVQGKILAGNVRFKKGQSFKKGDLLIRIYDKEAGLNLQSRKSRFLTSIANILPDFKIDYPHSYETWVDFFESIDITKNLPDLPEISSNPEKIFLSSRNILSDYYTIRSEEERFRKHYIYAPFNGSFTQVLMEVGAIANPGSRLATIIQTDKLELEVPVEVDDIQWVSIGDPVKVTTEDETGEWTGKVVRKADFVDPATQSISVFISLNSSRDNPLYQGQYLRAYFQGKVIKNSMEISRSAVFNRDQVFIIVDGKLQKEQIYIEKVSEEKLVFNSVNEGTMLVIEPLINAIENTSVEILD